MKNDRVIDILDEIAKIVIAHEEELTDLDRAIGDGDHGLNLKRGFDAVMAKVDYFRENEDNMDLSKLLNETAMILLSTVGGASGPLYATALMWRPMRAFCRAKPLPPIGWRQMISSSVFPISC